MDIMPRFPALKWLVFRSRTSSPITECGFSGMKKKKKKTCFYRALAAWDQCFMSDAPKRRRRTIKPQVDDKSSAALSRAARQTRPKELGPQPSWSLKTARNLPCMCRRQLEASAP